MFSVIIPLYNKQDSILNSVQSVLDQSYKDFELLVVDDGSTDGSVLKLTGLSDNRIRLISKSNGGVCSARNRGIEEARYPYVAFLDADDVWEPDFLFEQKRLIEEYPESRMWGCAYGFIQNNIKEEYDHLFPEGFKGVVTDYFQRKKKTNIFCSSSVVIDKTIFEKIEVFDERMKIGEDLDMWYRIILNFPVVFFNRILAYYSLDSENKAMHTFPPLQSCLFYYIEKYEEYRHVNREFRLFFDAYCLRQLFPYYLQPETRDLVKKKLKNFSSATFTLRWRLQYYMPNLFRVLFKVRF